MWLFQKSDYYSNNDDEKDEGRSIEKNKKYDDCKDYGEYNEEQERQERNEDNGKGGLRGSHSDDCAKKAVR